MYMHLVKNIFFIALFFACIALANGCAPKKLPPAQISDPQAMLKEIWRSSHPDKTFRALASIRIESPEGTYATKAALLTHDPFYLRLETIPAFGTPDLLLTLNSVNMKAFFARQAKFYIAPPERGISLIVPVNLAPSEIVPLLRGSLPLSVLSPDISIKAFLDGGLYKFDLFRANKNIRSLWIDRSSGQLVKMEIPGITSYSIYFSSFRKVEGAAVPCVIEIITGDEKRLLVRYSELDFLSEPEDADTFDLSVPPGIEPSIVE
jgi:hypothetical protein